MSLMLEVDVGGTSIDFHLSDSAFGRGLEERVLT